MGLGRRPRRSGERQGEEGGEVGVARRVEGVRGAATRMGFGRVLSLDQRNDRKLTESRPTGKVSSTLRLSATRQRL